MICSKLVKCLSKIFDPCNYLLQIPKQFLSYSTKHTESDNSTPSIPLKNINNKLDLVQCNSHMSCTVNSEKCTNVSDSTHRSISCQSIFQSKNFEEVYLYQNTVSDLLKELAHCDRVYPVGDAPKISKSDILVYKNKEINMKKPSTAPSKVDIEDSDVREVCQRAMQTCSEVKQMISHYVKSLENVQKITNEVEMEVASLAKSNNIEKRIDSVHRKQNSCKKEPCIYCTKPFQVSKSYFCPCCRKRLNKCTCTLCPHCNKLRIKNKNQRVINVNRDITFNSAKNLNQLGEIRKPICENIPSSDIIHNTKFKSDSSRNRFYKNNSLQDFVNEDYQNKSLIKQKSTTCQDEIKKIHLNWIDSPKRINNLSLTKSNMEKPSMKRSELKTLCLDDLIVIKKSISKKKSTSSKREFTSSKKGTAQCLEKKIKSNENILVNSSNLEKVCKDEEDDLLCELPNAVRDLPCTVREMDECEIEKLEKYFGNCYQNHEYFQRDKYSYHRIQEWLQDEYMCQPNANRKP